MFLQQLLSLLRDKATVVKGSGQMPDALVLLAIMEGPFVECFASECRTPQEPTLIWAGLSLKARKTCTCTSSMSFALCHSGARPS